VFQSGPENEQKSQDLSFLKMCQTDKDIEPTACIDSKVLSQYDQVHHISERPQLQTYLGTGKSAFPFLATRSGVL
jgi:hypothetical protein